jgi:hypothetical protein
MRLNPYQVFATRISSQTVRKIILVAALGLMTLNFIGPEKIRAASIVLDANGNRVEHHRS